jgi:hypothetical protein
MDKLELKGVFYLPNLVKKMALEGLAHIQSDVSHLRYHQRIGSVHSTDRKEYGSS